jgi:hypothetical protein
VDDAHCGLRAIRKDAFLGLRLTGTGMEFASEMVIKASLKGLRIDEVPATLSPDLRERAPHLRPWRDGWRHLRYLFMLSPTWVFGVPAMLTTVCGLAILVIAALHLLGILGGPVYFGNSWTIIAGFMVTTGHIASIMAVATHLYGVSQGYRRLHPLLGRMARFMTLENALLIGGVLVLLSALSLAVIGVWWRDLGFAALPTTMPLVVAVTLGVVGLQTALGGFLLAVIGGNDARLVETGLRNK